MAAQLRTHARIALLAKLESMLASAPVRVERRGERESIAATVGLVAGFGPIMLMLRDAGARQSARPAACAAGGEHTIEGFGGPLSPRTLALMGPDAAARSIVPEAWNLRDRSASGCRLRGTTTDLNRILPGGLIAMRAAEASGWTLAFVRRLRRLMVDHVELGVEFVGSRPRFVKVLIDDVAPTAAGVPTSPVSKCIGALYLPPSSSHPNLPLRTLLLPAQHLGTSPRVTLLAANAVYMLDLLEPIRREIDFVQIPFAVRTTGVVTAAPG